MIDKIYLAKEVATLMHSGQKRKYTGEDYISHPISVYHMMTKHTDDKDLLSATILHDVVEDTEMSIETIEKLFGKKTAEYVWFLTKPPSNVGNRATRKKMDRVRLASAPEMVKLIKVMDTYHNAQSIYKYDKKFWKTFRMETWLLLEAMQVDKFLPNDFYQTYKEMLEREE